MLHSFHFHTYACYCALLCLVYQQQQAVAITIIIDGATTNEWATRDEYQRLVDSSQGLAGGASSGSGDEPAAGELSQSPLIAANGGRGASAPSDFSGRPPGRAGRLLAPLRAPAHGTNHNHHQHNQASYQQQYHKQQLLQRQQPADDVYGEPRDADELAAAASQRDALQLQRGQLVHQEQPATANGVPAARTLLDLVPVGDDDLDDPLRRLKERNSSPQRYCGPRLMDVLDLVCGGRFYGGEVGEPEIVAPTIKSSKRSAQAAKLSSANSALENQLKKAAPGGAAEPEDADGARLDEAGLLNQSRRNRHSKMSLYRRIRGASTDCCVRSCYLDELKPYCKP